MMHYTHYTMQHYIITMLFKKIEFTYILYILKQKLTKQTDKYKDML